MMSNKSELESIYLRHHERGKRYGYLYCGGARGEYLHRWIGKGKRILDLGCRDGMLTSYYVEGNEVLGVDIDRKALESIEARLHIKTLWLDLNAEWPFPPNSFDVIVACEIVEHLFFLDSFLNNVSATLKPEGQFIGSVPNAFRMKNRFQFLFGHEYDRDPTHVRQFSYFKLKSTLESRFSHLEIIPLQGKVLPFVSVSPFLPYFAQRLFGKDLLWRCQVDKNLSLQV